MILLIKIRRRSVTICETLQPGKVANRYVAFTHFWGKIWKNLEKKQRKKSARKTKIRKIKNFRTKKSFDKNRPNTPDFYADFFDNREIANAEAMRLRF